MSCEKKVNKKYRSSIKSEDIFNAPNDVYLTELGRKIQKVLIDAPSDTEDFAKIGIDKVQLPVIKEQFKALVSERNKLIESQYNQLLPNVLKAESLTGTIKR